MSRGGQEVVKVLCRWGLAQLDVLVGDTRSNLLRLFGQAKMRIMKLVPNCLFESIPVFQCYPASTRIEPAKIVQFHSDPIWVPVCDGI
jgi:hypothetical protein